MAHLGIETGRFVLRDFREADRGAFVAYQCDPRYRALYDLDHDPTDAAGGLFDRFVAWQAEALRTHIQLGIFGWDGALLGSAGLRDVVGGTAELGIELAPGQWGRFALALDVTAALLDYGFDTLGLDTVTGSTASGNRRVARLARWFGARIVAERAGPDWMAARGWREVDWSIDRDAWRTVGRRRPDRQSNWSRRRP